MSDGVNSGAIAHGVRSQPPCQLASLQNLPAEFEAALRRQILRRQRLQQPVAQYTKLQTVEQLVGRFAIPRSASQIVDMDIEVKVAHQRVDSAIAQHVLDPGLELLGGLALQLTGVQHEII